MVKTKQKKKSDFRYIELLRVQIRRSILNVSYTHAHCNTIVSGIPKHRSLQKHCQIVDV